MQNNKKKKQTCSNDKAKNIEAAIDRPKRIRSERNYIPSIPFSSVILFEMVLFSLSLFFAIAKTLEKQDLFCEIGSESIKFEIHRHYQI